MKPYPIQKTSTVSCQQYCNARMTIVINCSSKHVGLQSLIHSLLATAQTAPLKQFYFDTCLLQAIPNMTHGRRHRPNGNRRFQFAPSQSQAQQVIKLYPHLICSIPAFALRGDCLGADKNV